MAPEQPISGGWNERNEKGHSGEITVEAGRWKWRKSISYLCAGTRLYPELTTQKLETLLIAAAF
jgi:hypothetical protein